MPPSDQLSDGRWPSQPRPLVRGLDPALAALPGQSAGVSGTPALQPAPARLSTGQVDDASHEDELTSAGLPRRGHGSVPPDGVNGSADPAPPGPPDPDTVRARLSSLAKGLAAARRSSNRPS